MRIMRCRALVLAPQNAKTQMRTLKIFEHITLDGVIPALR